jgi:hypothetical protein
MCFYDGLCMLQQGHRSDVNLFMCSIPLRTRSISGRLPQPALSMTVYTISKCCIDTLVNRLRVYVFQTGQLNHYLESERERIICGSWYGRMLARSLVAILHFQLHDPV